MNEFPILLSWSSAQSPDSLGYQVLILDYQQESTLASDRYSPHPQRVAEGALAMGWGLGRRGELLPWVERQVGWKRHLPCRIQKPRLLMSACGGYGFFTSSSPAGWDPDQLWMWCRRSGAKWLIWEQPGSQVLALQWDPLSNGLWLAIRCPKGSHQLLYIHGREVRCWLRHRLFAPSHFVISLTGQWLAFIHRLDNQIYRMDLATRRLDQLNLTGAEWECREGLFVHRHSLQISPDSQRLFYATSYLQIGGPIRGGSLYALSTRVPAQPRRIALEGIGSGVCVRLHVPNALCLSSANPARSSLVSQGGA
jgi:hypothetical protein